MWLTFPSHVPSQKKQIFRLQILLHQFIFSARSTLDAEALFAQSQAALMTRSQSHKQMLAQKQLHRNAKHTLTQFNDIQVGPPTQLFVFDRCPIDALIFQHCRLSDVKSSFLSFSLYLSFYFYLTLLQYSLSLLNKRTLYSFRKGEHEPNQPMGQTN